MYRKKFTRSGVVRRQRTGRMRHYFKRSWLGSANVQTSITENPSFVGSLFRLNQVPDYTEFTNLFDNYKIHGIKMTFYRPSLSNSDALNTQVLLHTVYDYDDASAPSSVNQMVQYDNYKVVSLTNQFMKNGKVTRFFKPRTLTEVYRGPASTGYSPTTRGVFDTQYNDIPHYGLKWALEAIDSDGVPVTWPSDMTVRYQLTYYMSFGKVW